MDVLLERVSQRTPGFVGADLANLLREAALSSLEAGEAKSGSPGPAITWPDFQKALERVRPALLESAHVAPHALPLFEDLGGVGEIRRDLELSVLLPFRQPELFLAMGLSGPRGVLLAGPSGTGKTSLALAVAKAAQMSVVMVEAGALRSKVIGESEAALAALFLRARKASPCLLVIDQLELLAQKRPSLSSNDPSSSSSSSSGRLVALLLTELDGIFGKREQESFDSEVVVVATTSQLEMIDPAILRPGRIDRIVHVPLPDLQARKEIFQIKLSKIPLDSSEMSQESLIETLSARTAGKSGAEIENICREAVMTCLRQNINSKLLDPRFLLEATEKKDVPKKR